MRPLRHIAFLDWISISSNMAVRVEGGLAGGGDTISSPQVWQTQRRTFTMVLMKSG